MVTVLHLRPNTWLRRITDRWELIKVINVHTDGQVDLLLLDGTRTHAPISFLRGDFERADDGA